MYDRNRFVKANKKMPVLCFRADPEFKEIIIKYGMKMGFIDEETGRVNMDKTLHEIVEDYLKTQGIIKLKYESTI